MKQDAKTQGIVKSAGLVTGAVAIVGAVGYGLTGVHSSQANPTPDSGPVASSASTAPKTAADYVPYTPSKYPGVMVRNVPSASQGGGKGWLYVRPGTPKPRFGARVGSRGAVWFEAGKTPAGGTVAHVTRDFYPYEVAKIGPDGKVHLDCVEPGGEVTATKPKAQAPAKPTRF